MSQLLNILKNSKLKLPLIYKNGETDIINLLNDVFTELTKEMSSDENYTIIREENYEKIRTYSAKVIATISRWFEGNISEAKKTFNDTLKERLLLLPRKIVPSGQCFYRVRTSSEHKILGKKDLFHIPFELRNKISTQRFSIPGFPCLYLGNTVYICWEELNRPNFHDIQVAKFENQSEINLYNLSYEQYNIQKLESQNPTDSDLINLLLAYPIIAACSIQIPQNRQLDPFKPEYLIPQIVLQTLIEQKDSTSIGIVYSSTKIYKNGSKNEGSFENFILPTTSEVRAKGYCSDLTKLFNMTSVVAGWPVDFVSSYNTQNNSCSFEVAKLDLDGIVVNYGDTQFALLEKALGDKVVTPILPDFIGT
ncbi:MAG: hypothetical protein V4585_09510 [Bacteroidota bacterium]